MPQVAVHVLFRPPSGKDGWAGLAEPSGFPQPETPIAWVRDYAGSLARTLGLAGALVEAGRRIDLAGLDLQVGLLCARALDLDPEEGRLVRAELVALRESVDALAALLARPPPFEDPPVEDPPVDDPTGW